MKRLFSIAFCDRRHRFLVLLTVFSMCFMTFASQLEMFALGVLTNKQDGNSSSGMSAFDQAYAYLDAFFPITGHVGNLCLFLIFVALFKAATMFVHRYSTKLVAIRVSRDLRESYFVHIQALPMDFYQKYNIGSLSSRVVGDAAQIAESIEACLVNYIQTPFTVSTTLFFCFLMSWKLSLLIFLGLPILMFPIVFLGRRVKSVSKQIQQNQERFASVIIDFLSGIQTVKIFAMEEFSLKKYQEQNQRMALLEQKNARYDLSTRPVVHTIAMFFVALTLLFGLYILNMTIPEVFVFCGLLYLFYEPIKKFAEENSRIQRGVAAAERMFEVMDLKPKIQDVEKAEGLKSFVGPIEFDRVWFRYQDEWILKDVSFTIQKGETVAIVGPTGAGKSTIVQLLPRLYDVDKGEIRINGKPLKSYTQKSLRDNIGFVPQRPFLFFDTVSENISYGRKFSFQQIKDAAIKAYADEFICRLPKGYETELSETGKNLSGGQQQRLAIARALVKEAPILIMDEATSALDTVSESRIKAALHQLRGEATQIIIAHRLSTIEDADKIIYLERGEKIAEGSCEELLKTCSGFRLMWEMMHNQSKNLQEEKLL